jgi:hypothetical protein
VAFSVPPNPASGAKQQQQQKEFFHPAKKGVGGVTAPASLIKPCSRHKRSAILQLLCIQVLWIRRFSLPFYPQASHTALMR